MANRYVYSGAAGAGTGADWANAHTTVVAAITAGAAGDTYYIAHDHNESTAGAVTITPKGTDASPDSFICVDRAGSVPPAAADLRTTAAISNTGAGNNMTIAGGRGFFYGITFNCGVGVATASNLSVGSTTCRHDFWFCSFRSKCANSSTITFASTGVARITCESCTYQVNNTGTSLQVNSGRLDWRNHGAAFLTGGVIPSTLFSFGGTSAQVEFSGADFSGLGAVNLVGGGGAGTRNAVFKNCRIDSNTVRVTAIPALLYAGEVRFIGCDSSTPLSNQAYSSGGVLTTETTIVRTGGADDGVTPYSWKFTADADNERNFPFTAFEGTEWNEDTGSSKTLTVHTVTDNVTLTDAEIWLEVEYLGNASYPLASFVSDGAGPIGATNQASSSETWTTTGLGTPVYQKLEATFTPQLAGPYRWKVRIAKASGVIYICPKAVLS